MFVDLIDKLRCPNAHADAWLVAAVTRVEHRHLIDATLGCPECGAEYEVRNGEVCFAAVAESSRSAAPPSDEESTRAAALLGLQEHGLFVLDGAWSVVAEALTTMLDCSVLVVDPPKSRAGVAGQGTLRGVGDRWPLADGAVHGIALDDPSLARTTDAVRVLRAAGRLVAPVAVPLPAGVRELARDERHWVAEKVGDVIPLKRRR